ncbi:hypothetical protein ACFRQM_18530 [Streptomyces sp. NPDC056831]|uniref:DUF2804 family protein n=1 Tax=Streptomyces sp. NPDC056831 TaxID=3345954 RepID=UPI00367B9912
MPGIEHVDDERCDRDHREDDHDGDQGVHAVPAPFDAQADKGGSPGAVHIQATPQTGTRPRTAAPPRAPYLPTFPQREKEADGAAPRAVHAGPEPFMQYASPPRRSADDRPLVDLTFTPFHNRSTRTGQCFGHCTGRIRDDKGREIAVDRFLGRAEDVHMRW